MPRMPNGIATDHRAPREWFPALTVAVALALPHPAGADVLVKQKTVSEGLGGFGNASTQGTLIVSGDRSRNEDQVTYTGRFKTLVGKKPSTSVLITRLDKELVWNLDPAKQQYSELTFAETRAMMEQGSKQASEKPTGAGRPEDEGMKFSVDVKRTGAKQDVNGFPCEQVVITCTGKPTDPKQAEAISEIRMTMDQWITQKAPGAAEIASYQRKFAEKFGHDAGMAHLAAARTMYGNGIKELTGKLKDLEGFPIRSTFTIESTMTDETKQQLASAQKDAAKAQSDAEQEKERAKAERAEQQKKEDAAEAKSLGSSIGSGGGLGGALGGFLGKKASKTAARKASAAAEAKASSAASTPSADGPLFKSVTEVLSISMEAAPAGSFEVPAGYARQKK